MSEQFGFDQCFGKRRATYANKRTGRAWALSYDIAGMTTERIYDVLINDWKKMVDEGWVEDKRYLHQSGKPVAAML